MCVSPDTGSAFPIVLDRGNLECRVWTNHQKIGGQEAKADQSWVLGYFSGWNTWGKHDEIHGLFLNYDAHNLIDWVNRYCTWHPNAIIAEAATDLIDGLKRGVEQHNAEIKKRDSK